MAEVLLVSAFGLAAFVAAVAAVLCLAGVLHWGHRRDRGLIAYVFYPVILVGTLAVLLSGRNLYLPLEALVVAPKLPMVVWATRGATLFLVFAAAERIGRRFLQHGPKPDAPTALILAFWLFFLTNVVTSALFGTRPWFSHEHFYIFLAGYAALLVTPQEGDTAIVSARNAFFFFLVLSALCIPWRPEMVFKADYQGLLLPGLKLRYAGLATHPNTLGPAVVAFLLCLWKKPYANRWLNRLGWTIACASLVLTQSKTSWVAFVVCLSCLAYFRHRESLARLLDFRRTLLPAGVLVLAMLATVAVGVAFMSGDVAERVTAFLRTREGGDLLTLVGRDRIWDVAVEEWRRSPLFGYGLTIWNEDYRARIGMPGIAFHAHNQFFQSLATAGLFGAAGLAIYSATLLWFALKTAKASDGLTLALFVLLFLHSITEVPLSLTSGYALPQLKHLLLLMVIASQLTSSRAESRDTGMPVRARPAPA